MTAAINEAAGGSREKMAVKATQAELVALMRLLASYVTVTADGDMAKLLASAFPRQKPTRSRIGELDAPNAPRVRQ